MYSYLVELHHFKFPSFLLFCTFSHFPLFQKSLPWQRRVQHDRIEGRCSQQAVIEGRRRHEDRRPLQKWGTFRQQLIQLGFREPFVRHLWWCFFSIWVWTLNIPTLIFICTTFFYDFPNRSRPRARYNWSKRGKFRGYIPGLSFLNVIYNHGNGILFGWICMIG